MKKTVALALVIPLLLVASPLGAKKFYDDDPLEKEPTPVHVENASVRKLNDYYDFFRNTFAKPGERHAKEEKDGTAGLIPAQAVNTLGEVPDSAWFTNRIGFHPVSIEELLKGPGNENAPSMNGKWRIIAAKTEGVSPGFRIQDTLTGKTYVLKFDSLAYPEMATGADMIGSAFFHALGYHVPENYLVTFDERQLVVGEDTTIADAGGRRRPLSRRDVTETLLRVPRDAHGRIRGVASYFLKGFIGEFRYHGTRKDDPNDVVPHEHRSDLRGLFVFCAWLGHHDSRSINTLDALVEENGLKYIKHHLIDFGSLLGSKAGGDLTPREGNEYLYEFKPAAIQVLTLGLHVPRWARIKYRRIRGLGLFEYRNFDPEKWKPNYPSPAFQNRLPDDSFWAAKKVMSFSDEQIRAMVKLGQYSDPEAAPWLAKCLIERRNKIGETYFSRVLPLDAFRINGDRLEFEDLQVKYGFINRRDYTVRWSRFDNDSETHEPIAAAASFVLPEGAQSAAMGSYFAAVIRGEDKEKTVAVYMRKHRAGYKVVGIERTW